MIQKYLIIPKMNDPASSYSERCLFFPENDAEKHSWIVVKKNEITTEYPNSEIESPAVLVFSDAHLYYTPEEYKKNHEKIEKERSKLASFLKKNHDTVVFIHGISCSDVDFGAKCAQEGLKELRVDSVLAEKLKPIYISRTRQDIFPWSEKFYGGEISSILKKMTLENRGFDKLIESLSDAANDGRKCLYPGDLFKSGKTLSESQINKIAMDVLLGMTGTYVAIQSLLGRGEQLELDNLLSNITVDGNKANDESVDEFLHNMKSLNGFGGHGVNQWIDGFYDQWKKTENEEHRQKLASVMLILFGIRALSQSQSPN